MHDVIDSQAIHGEITQLPAGNDRARRTGRRLILVLHGPLALRAADGTDLTPRARKAQGLLALLGTAPQFKRSRAWLQDKLWSDRGPDQGAASLRQCLSEIRRRLGSDVDCLITRRGWVELDADRVEVQAVAPQGADPTSGEFLEGLDIRDPEFEHWLRDQRLSREDEVPPSAPVRSAGTEPAAGAAADADLLRTLRPLVVADPAEATDDNLRLVADMVTEDVALQIARGGNGEVVRPPLCGDGGRPVGVRIAARATELGGLLYLQLRLTALHSGEVLWLDLRELPRGEMPKRAEGPIALLINEAVAVAVEELARMGDRAGDRDRLTLLGYRASRHTILLDLGEQEAQDRMLREAFAIDPRGVYLARRALLNHNRAVERTALSCSDARAEAIALARRGLELDPTNATVVATAAKICLNLEHRIEGGTTLACKAVEIGPNNPLAWEARATAHAHAGEAGQAHEAALRARAFAAHLPQTYLWEMVCCMTACVAGRLDDAVRFGTRANDLAPAFRPPLRYLAALHYARGDSERARTHLLALKAIEPDFTLEAMASEEYPLAALRQTPLIAIAQSGLI